MQKNNMKNQVKSLNIGILLKILDLISVILVDK